MKKSAKNCNYDTYIQEFSNRKKLSEKEHFILNRVDMRGGFEQGLAIWMREIDYSICWWLLLGHKIDGNRGTVVYYLGPKKMKNFDFRYITLLIFLCPKRRKQIYFYLYLVFEKGSLVLGSIFSSTFYFAKVCNFLSQNNSNFWPFYLAAKRKSSFQKQERSYKVQTHKKNVSIEKELYSTHPEALDKSS